MILFPIHPHTVALSAVFVALFMRLISITAESVHETKPPPAESDTTDDNKDDEKNSTKVSVNEPDIDPNGYIIYCPCMGQFGNQVEHFLGTLGFAKNINRTLVIPPFRTYFKNVPFDEFFQLEKVHKYHRALLAHDFMKRLAPKVWPKGQRIGFCWLPGGSIPGVPDYCAMKEGNPFGPFWDALDVDFDSYIVYTIMYLEHARWPVLYPPDKYPVLAMRGAPASYPVNRDFAYLHSYLEWNKEMEEEADHYISTSFPDQKFLAIHLRNGPDWDNVCQLVKSMDMTQILSSVQCLGYFGDGAVTFEMCMPPAETILKQTKTAVEHYGATVVYVLTDKDPMLQQLGKALGEGVRVINHDPWKPQLDLIIAAKADHFIGNCISSFSAFISRERMMKQTTVSYWTIPDLHTKPYAGAAGIAETIYGEVPERRISQEDILDLAEEPDPAGKTDPAEKPDHGEKLDQVEKAVKYKADL